MQPPSAKEQPDQTRRFGLRNTLPFLAAGVLALTFLTIPRHPFIINDALSDRAVLSYAHERGWQFGTDIVCTYGPLAFLTSRQFFPHAASLRLVVDVLLCLTVAAGICLASWRLGHVWRCLVPIAFALLASNLEPRVDLLLYVGLLCWGLLCFVESGARLAACAAAFVSVAAFSMLVKVSFLAVVSLSVAAIAGDLIFRQQWRIAAGLVAGVISTAIAGWCCAGQSPSHLPVFLTRATWVIRSYDQVMGLEGLPALRDRALLVLILALAAVMIWLWCSLRSAQVTASSPPSSLLTGRIRPLLLSSWLLLILFAVWKHGFVRADLEHNGIFFGFAPMLVLLLELLPANRPFPQFWIRGLGLGCSLAAFATVQGYFTTDLGPALAQPVRALCDNFRDLTHPASYRRRMEAAYSSAGQTIALPRLREIIGASTVDVFGSDQCYCLFNDFNYRPRPVFQSYVAYNRALQRLNEVFYCSSAAPEFVLFRLAPTDRKFPPLEDARVLRHLLINYRPVDREGGFLLLKYAGSLPARLTLLQEGKVGPGEPIALEPYGARNLWMEIEVEPTLLGRIRQLLYKPPRMRLAPRIEPAPARITRYPAPAPLLSAGFVASPLLLTDSAFSAASGEEQGQRPTAYSAEEISGQERFWKPEIRYRIYRIENGIGGR